MESVLARLRYSYRVLNPRGAGSIKLPSNLSILDGSESGLIIEMNSEQVVRNMQTDETAFEGWAIVLHRWLSDKPKIVLKWEAPKETDLQDSAGVLNTKGQHYQRFLYRAERMAKFYLWFTIHNDSQDLLSASRILSTDGPFLLNRPNQKGKDSSEVHRKSVEAHLERSIQENPDALLREADIDEVYFQLPVGVFEKKVTNSTRVFTGGKSAIDLWGVNEKKKVVKIFELKAPKNRKVGIISELMFYAMLLADAMGDQPLIKLVHGKGDKLEQTRGSTEAFELWKSADSLEAIFLTKDLHPLIDDSVLECLNDQIGSRKIYYSHLNLKNVVELEK